VTEEVAGLPRFNEGVGGVQGELLQWGEIKKKSVLVLVAAVGEYELSSAVV
jgi:hypothetical protein